MSKMIKTFILLSVCLVSLSAQAVLRIEITQGVSDGLPIAVVPFQWQVQAGALPVDVAQIIENDLNRSGQFKAIPRDEMLNQPVDGKDINFLNWRKVGAEYIIVGKLLVVGEATYSIEYQLMDVLKGKQLLGFKFPARAKELRNLAHHISDLVYEAITGERGAFNTRIAYVSAERHAQQRAIYKLEIADTDGYNAKTILTSRHPIMSPSWSPDSRSLAYVSFENRQSEIYVQNVFEEKRRRIASFKGINGAPVWSPDGQRLALTLSRGGNPDIYVYSLQDKSLRQITRHWSIDTEPVWTPDGKALIFTSGRGGSPQLYEKSLDSLKTRARRLTFEGKYNASADISPDGRIITMVHGTGNRFQIAVLDRKTGLLQVLTDGRLDESPSFASNGSMILYASEDRGRGVLAAVSVDGRIKQKLTLNEGDIREPTWAPFPPGPRRP